jgi:hypothetical protein
VVLVRKVASTIEGGDRLSASTHPSGGQWLSGRLGLAHRRMRAVRSGQRLEQRRMVRGRAEWASAWWLLQGREGKRGFASVPRR